MKFKIQWYTKTPLQSVILNSIVLVILLKNVLIGRRFRQVRMWKIRYISLKLETQKSKKCQPRWNPLAHHISWYSNPVLSPGCYRIVVWQAFWWGRKCSTHQGSKTFVSEKAFTNFTWPNIQRERRNHHRNEQPLVNIWHFVEFNLE